MRNKFLQVGILGFLLNGCLDAASDNPAAPQPPSGQTTVKPYVTAHRELDGLTNLIYLHDKEPMQMHLVASERLPWMDWVNIVRDNTAKALRESVGIQLGFKTPAPYDPPEHGELADYWKDHGESIATLSAEVQSGINLAKDATRDIGKYLDVCSVAKPGGNEAALEKRKALNAKLDRYTAEIKKRLSRAEELRQMMDRLYTLKAGAVRAE